MLGAFILVWFFRIFSQHQLLSSSASSACSLFIGSPHQVVNLHLLRSCVSSIFTTFSVMCFLITSLHLSYGLPMCQCPLTSIFHVLITTSLSVFLSTRPNHLSLTSLVFSLMFSTPAIGLSLIYSFLIVSALFISTIHLNILTSVRSSKFSSTFRGAQVPLPYIITDLMTVVCTPSLLVNYILRHFLPSIHFRVATLRETPICLVVTHGRYAGWTIMSVQFDEYLLLLVGGSGGSEIRQIETYMTVVVTTIQLNNLHLRHSTLHGYYSIHCKFPTTMIHLIYHRETLCRCW